MAVPPQVLTYSKCVQLMWTGRWSPTIAKMNYRWGYALSDSCRTLVNAAHRHDRTMLFESRYTDWFIVAVGGSAVFEIVENDFCPLFRLYLRPTGSGLGRRLIKALYDYTGLKLYCAPSGTWYLCGHCHGTGWTGQEFVHGMRVLYDGELFTKACRRWRKMEKTRMSAECCAAAHYVNNRSRNVEID